jgi:hypothetical protein
MLIEFQLPRVAKVQASQAFSMAWPASRPAHAARVLAWHKENL